MQEQQEVSLDCYKKQNQKTNALTTLTLIPLAWESWVANGMWRDNESQSQGRRGHGCSSCLLFWSTNPTWWDSQFYFLGAAVMWRRPSHVVKPHRRALTHSSRWYQPPGMTANMSLKKSRANIYICNCIECFPLRFLIAKTALICLHWVLIIIQ